MKYNKLLYLIILTLVVIGCSRSDSNKVSSTVKEKLNIANKLMMQGNYQEAALAYNEVIKIDPKVPIGYQGISNAYILMDKEDKAEKILKEGLDKVPVKEPLELSLAQVYVSEKKYDQAKVLYENNLDSEKTTYENYSGLAQYYVENNENEKAKSTLKDGIVKFPSSGELYNLLAQIYLLEGNKDEAFNQVIEGLEHHLNLNDAYKTLVKIYGNNKEELVTKCQELMNSKVFVGKPLMVLALVSNGRNKEAINLFEENRDFLTDNIKGIITGAIAYIKNGEPQKAQELISSLDSQTKEFEELYNIITSYYLLIDNKEKAQEYALQAASFDAKEAKLNTNVINISTEAGLKLSIEYFVPQDLEMQYVFNSSDGNYTSQWRKDNNQFKEAILYTNYDTGLIIYNSQLDGIYDVKDFFGYYESEFTIDTITSGQQLLFKYVLPGDTWENRYHLRSVESETYERDYQENYQFLGFEKMNVLGKEVSAAHLQVHSIEEESNKIASDYVRDYWYVKGIGLVKLKYYTKHYGEYEGSYRGTNSLVRIEPKVIWRDFPDFEKIAAEFGK